MAAVRPRPAPSPRAVIGGAAATLLVVVVGLIVYVTSPAHRLHDPDHALQQLDLLYLDEPAPAADRLRIAEGAPALVVVCTRCEPPVLDAQVRVTADPDIARAYGLQRPDGGVGPGYAIVDPSGRVRYRTYDPSLDEHREEIATLLRGVR